MRLYIKQRVFSVRDKYDIYDENQNSIFHVWSKIISLGAQIFLCDMNGQELYHIKERITMFLKKYELYQGERLVASIQQNLKLFNNSLSIQSSYGNFEIQGDFLAMDFQIYQDGSTIGIISKKWFSWGDSYELSIQEGVDAAFFTALVITIDNCIHNGNG